MVDVNKKIIEDVEELKNENKSLRAQLKKSVEGQTALKLKMNKMQEDFQGQIDSLMYVQVTQQTGWAPGCKPACPNFPVALALEKEDAPMHHFG